MGYKEITRELALERMNAGWGIIDASGRVRVTKERNTTALASQNGIKYSVKSLAYVKKQIRNKYLQPKHKKKYSAESLIARIHAIEIYYCLKNNLKKMPGVFICGEGINPALLRQHLRNLLGGNYDASKIRIHQSLRGMLGKKNIGHNLAYNVNKKGKKAKESKKLSKKNFLKFLK